MLWYILAGIVIFLWLLLMIPLSLTVSLGEDGEIKLCGRVLGMAVYRFPKKEHPFRISRYTPSAIRRRNKAKLQRQKKRRSPRKQKKTRQISSITSRASEDMSMSEKISLIRDIASAVFRDSLKHARVDVERLAITVAASDAATAAILYGAVCASLAALTEVLHTFSHLHIRDASQYGVAIDYTSEKSRADIHICFRLRVHHVISIAAHTVLRVVARMMNHK